ncbi:MAG: hypothetical protein KC656_10995, partial [Myxococcales bacterium]|nr:hypothetical protein [Myxococcales bacterium]
IDANKARQRELNREVESYEARRRSATRILENGTGDAAAAERQLASVAEVLDTLETELLEKMEALEELESERTQAAADAADAAAFLEAEKAGHDGKIAALKAKFTAILPEREATLALLDKTILGRYETLLSRRGRAIAEIVDGSCSGCQRVVRQQNIADLQRGLMYACDGCGRWLLPPDPG